MEGRRVTHLRAADTETPVPPRAVLRSIASSAVYEADVIVDDVVVGRVFELRLLASLELVGAGYFEDYASGGGGALRLRVSSAGGDADAWGRGILVDGPHPDVVVAAVAEDGVAAYLAGLEGVVVGAFSVHFVVFGAVFVAFSEHFVRLVTFFVALSEHFIVLAALVVFAFSVLARYLCSCSVVLAVGALDLTLATFTVTAVSVACVHPNFMALSFPVCEIGAPFCSSLFGWVALDLIVDARGMSDGSVVLAVTFVLIALVMGC